MSKQFKLSLVSAAVAVCASAPAFGAQTIGWAYANQLAKSWGDPNYGVCRGIDPACFHNWNVADRPMRVLIYSRTAGPRHGNLGPRMAAGINPPLTTQHVAQQALIRLLTPHGIDVRWSEDVTSLNSLGSYRAVIFMSPTRDTMWNHGRAVDPAVAVPTSTSAQIDGAKKGLRQFLQAGGGFVGIHNAFGTEYGWPYYEGLLGNANYYNHGANQNGTVQIVQPDPSNAGLPARWPFRDEWYNLYPMPTKVKFLATVDTSTLANYDTDSHPGHREFHPVSWCQYYDGGKVWVTTMGHDSGAFRELAGNTFPGAAEFQQHILNGILSVMTLPGRPFCT